MTWSERKFFVRYDGELMCSLAFLVAGYASGTSFSNDKMCKAGKWGSGVVYVEGAMRTRERN